VRGVFDIDAKIHGAEPDAAQHGDDAAGKLE
jgi:hypothetical protein